MFRNFAALGVSTLIRVLTGFAIFVLIARHWGAAKFGEFMYLFSIAGLLVCYANTGSHSKYSVK
jgi:O-antigen/teichoic acid export membrane protein